MTNSHDDLHKIVTQKEKDRTIISLKPDGTNEMPAMDALTRPGFMKMLSEDRGGLIYALSSSYLDDIIMLQGQAAALLPGLTRGIFAVTMPLWQPRMEDPDKPVPMWAPTTDDPWHIHCRGVEHGYGYLVAFDSIDNAGYTIPTDGVNKFSSVKDNITGRTSLLVSRGHGKNTKTVEYVASQVATALLTPAAGKKICVCGILTAADGNTGEIILDFLTSNQKVWRHYISMSARMSESDLHFDGDADEVLTVATTQGAKKAFILVKYREID